MAYLLPLYPLLKAGEALSIRRGNGRFPVGGDGWKCIDCYLPHDIDSEDEVGNIANGKLCSRCKVAWVREVGHVEYSDAFERSLGIWGGAAFWMLGICAMLLNESMGIWKEGAALYWITNKLLAPLLHLLHYLNPVYNIFIIIFLVIACLVMLSTMSVIAFLLCMNPSSKRHWRHMTRPMYGLLVVEVIYGVVLMAVGVLPLDLVCVFGPVYIGAASVVGALFFMRKDKNEGVVRLL